MKMSYQTLQPENVPEDRTRPAVRSPRGERGRLFPSARMAAIFLVSLLIWRCQTAPPGAKILAGIVVEAGPYERFDAPVSLDLSDLPYNEDGGRPVLYERTGKTRREVPCQLEPGIHPRLWWILSGTTQPGRMRSFELVRGDTLPPPARVTTLPDGRGLTVLNRGRNVLRYNHASASVPPGVDPLFRRSGFIHPLWSPSGFELTRIQPPDHVHHYGIWNPWTRVRFEGRETDFWNLGDGKGTVRFAGYLSRTDGPVFGGFKVLQEHVDLSVKGAEKTALDEVWDVRAWDTAGMKGPCFLIDLTTTLSCAGRNPVELEAYRYGGGIGFRAAEAWTRENVVLFTSEGKTRKDADGSPARWCDASGPSAGGNGRAGILFMSHPSNRSHPEPMRVWPVDANAGRGDLFFEFCPIRHREWMLTPGREYVLRYRLLVHEGGVPAGDCERAWRDFAFPPRVTIR
jgi:hypothetical protein